MLVSEGRETPSPKDGVWPNFFQFEPPIRDLVERLAKARCKGGGGHADLVPAVPIDLRERAQRHHLHGGLAAPQAPQRETYGAGAMPTARSRRANVAPRRAGRVATAAVELPRQAAHPELHAQRCVVRPERQVRVQPQRASGLQADA